MASRLAAPMTAPAAYSQPYASHASIADPFLDAKARSSRRASFEVEQLGRGSRRSASTVLSSVPENHQQHHPAHAHRQPSSTSVDPQQYSAQSSGSAPPSAYRLHDAMSKKSSRRTGAEASLPGQVEKGKQRQQIPHVAAMAASPQQLPKQKRADWILDLVEAQTGSQRWSAGPRVILVFGNASPSSLAPLLHNPAFSSTLLLIGSSQPIPAIDALLSSPQSNSPDQLIYPTIQTFNPGSDNKGSDSHVLTVLLAQATAFAQQYRAKFRTGISPPTRSARLRQNSEGSVSPVSSLSPPPIRKRVLSGLGLSLANRRESDDSDSSSRQSSRRSSTTEVARPDMPKIMSDSALSAKRDSGAKTPRGRLSSFARDSFASGLSKLADGSDIVANNNNLFDAVINFVPPLSDFQPERALQDMLHQAVVITTGVMPSLARPSPLSIQPVDPTSFISLVHVLPKRMPAPLPNVIESFLLSLLPRFEARCEQEVFGCVSTTPAWLAPTIETGPVRLSVDIEFSGAEALLFGGVRCPNGLLRGRGEGQAVRSRAFLPNWAACLPMPGLIADSRRPSDSTCNVPPARASASTASAMMRHPTDPPSIAFKDVNARTPPQSFDQKLPAPETQQLNAGFQIHTRSHSHPHLGQTPRRSKLSNVASASDIPGSPPTPDLDPSVSSCGSSFALGEMVSSGSTLGHGITMGSQRNSMSDTPIAGTGVGDSPGESVKEKKKGLSGWLKSKRNKA